MSRPIPLVAIILGVIALELAALYWFTPAGGLPSFIPGFRAGSDHIHVSHALGSLVVALILFAIARFLQRSSTD